MKRWQQGHVNPVLAFQMHSVNLPRHEGDQFHYGLLSDGLLPLREKLIRRFHNCMSVAANNSLAAIYRDQRLPIIAMLLLSLGLFLAGLFRPFTQVTKLWLFEDQVSVYRGLITLMKEQEFFLFGILLVFTVIFPFVKISALLVLWLKRGLKPAQMATVYRFVSNLSKWSMLDVFVVAVLVVLIRSGGLAEIKAQDGLLLFCASVVLTQIASEWTGRIAETTLKKD